MMPYKKFLYYLVFAQLFISPTFADESLIRTNEPDAKYLNVRLSLDITDSMKKIHISNNSFIVLDNNLFDVVIKNNPAIGFRTFNILTSYDLYVSGKQVANDDFLYLKCPIIRTTYIDRSERLPDMMEYGRRYSVMKPDSEVLKEVALYPGYYSFLPLSNSTTILTGSKFKMKGAVNNQVDLTLLCANIGVAYEKYRYKEITRNIILNKFEIRE